VNPNSQQNSATAINNGRAFGLSVNNGLTALSYQVPLVLPASRPTISLFTYKTNTVTMQWTSVPGHVYQVQYRSQVATGTWQNAGSVLNSVGPSVTYSETNVVDSARYYRVQVK
jgi:hypothetical protein